MFYKMKVHVLLSSILLLDDKVLYIVYKYLIDSYDKHKLIKFTTFKFLNS